MRLTSLTLQGFKSFGNRISVEFAPGVTAIVGPNGSGKSNLVDALKWTSGGGRAREFRAADKTDLIFHGASGKRSVGLAEVEVELSHGDQALKLYRSLSRDGTTRLRLNGKAARFLDLDEALAGSGLGKSGLSIIGQGEVSQVLMADPPKLLDYVAEVAGVARMSARREQTLARLETARSHLDRLQDVILESGNNYCVESSNALDYFTEENGAAPASVLAVHYPGDYGWDGAAGAKKWAAANEVDFANIEQTPVGAGGTTDGAISQIVSTNPDVVILTVAPTETAQIVGGAAAQGFTGRFIGNSPTWNPALLATPALPALQALYWQAAPWAPFNTDTAGHQAMRDTLALETGNDGYTAGWVWSYPLLAALNGAYDAGDLTPAGVVAAVAALGTVDYEGMLPEEAGNFGGTPREQAFGQTVIGAVDAESDSGVSLIKDFFEGPTQGAFPFDGPCFVEEGFAG